MQLDQTAVAVGAQWQRRLLLCKARFSLKRRFKKPKSPRVFVAIHSRRLLILTSASGELSSIGIQVVICPLERLKHFEKIEEW